MVEIFVSKKAKEKYLRWEAEQKENIEKEVNEVEKNDR
jgi:hypothetical protein